MQDNQRVEAMQTLEKNIVQLEEEINELEARDKPYSMMTKLRIKIAKMASRDTISELRQ